MNKLFSIFALSALLTATPVLAHEDHGKPMHGGFVLDAGYTQFEIVANDGILTVHASDHGKAVATAGGGGKLTVLTGTAKREIALKPFKDNLLQGEGVLNAGDRVLLNVTLPGKKPLSARTTVKAEGGHSVHHH